MTAVTADVVVVGAGIMGVSTAYHLARRGAGRIVVVERDDVCSGSTALASGGIRHQYANRIGVELTRHSIETYERFEAEFGVDPNFRQHGYLILVTTEAEQAQARAQRGPPAKPRRGRRVAVARRDAPPVPVSRHR